MTISWTALSAILFGLLLIFEVYRYFWPGLKAKRERRKEAMSNARTHLSNALTALSGYDSSSAPAPDPLFPQWLRDKLRHLQKEMTEYNLFLDEAKRIIRDALTASGSLKPLRDLWDKAGSGVLRDCVVECITSDFWEGGVEAGPLRDALMTRYGMNSQQVREALNSQEFYKLVEELNSMRKRKSVSHVGELKTMCMSLTKDILTRLT